MRLTPFLHAAGAATYIWSVGLLIHYISSLHHDTPDNLVGSVSALSLLVLSAAVMAFLFFYRPVVLLLEGKREEAITFFLTTLVAFGLLSALPLAFVALR